MLALEGVDQLVREHQPQLGPVGALDAEEHRRIGVVEAGDLLGVEVEEQRPELERVRQETEEPIGGLQPAAAASAAAPRPAWRSGSPAPARGSASPSAAER